MTPLQMAVQECPEMLPDGTCKGKKCVLGGGETCLFFEKDILPMAAWTTDGKRRADFEEAAKIYWSIEMHKKAVKPKKSAS